MGASRCHALVWLFVGCLFSFSLSAAESPAVPVVVPGDSAEVETQALVPGAEAEITPLAVTAPPPPSYVSNPATNNSGTYTVTWGGVVADYYTLQEKKGTGSWVQIAGSVWNESYLITGRTNGTYTYQVRACLDGKCGSYKTGTTSTTVTLVAPTVSLSASPAAIASGQSSTLTWSSTNAAACTLDGVAVALAGSKSTGALTATRTYNLSCTNPGFTTPKSTTVTIVPVPKVNITADATTIGINQSTTLRWTTDDASSCTLDGASVAVNSSKSTGALTSSRTYNLSCTGIGGTTPDSVTITVIPPPTVNFTADSTTIGINQGTTLRWTTSNASSCTLDGVSVAVNSSKATGALSSSRSYALSCTSLGGTTLKNVTITVIPAPTLTLTADANPIGYNQSTTVRWTSTNATSCTLDGASVAVNGSQSTGVLTANRNYSLACSGIGGSATKALTITVVPPPTAALTADALQIPINGSTTLRWTSTNATSCTLNNVSVAVNGSQSTGALSSSKLFTLSCSGLGGNKTSAVTVTPVASPIITLTADKNPIAEASATTLRWTSSNATSCTLNGASVATNGNASTGTLVATKLFTVQCTGPGGTGSTPLTISVVPLTQIWKTVGQCDVQTGKLTQVCVDSRFCTANSLQQVNGGCQQAVDCGS